MKFTDIYKDLDQALEDDKELQETYSVMFKLIIKLFPECRKSTKLDGDENTPIHYVDRKLEDGLGWTQIGSSSLKIEQILISTKAMDLDDLHFFSVVAHEAAHVAAYNYIWGQDDSVADKLHKEYLETKGHTKKWHEIVDTLNSKKSKSNKKMFDIVEKIDDESFKRYFNQFDEGMDFQRLRKSQLDKALSPKEKWDLKMDIAELKKGLTDLQDTTSRLPDDYINEICNTDNYPFDSPIDNDFELNRWCDDVDNFLDNSIPLNPKRHKGIFTESKVDEVKKLIKTVDEELRAWSKDKQIKASKDEHTNGADFELRCRVIGDGTYIFATIPDTIGYFPINHDLLNFIDKLDSDFKLQSLCRDSVNAWTVYSNQNKSEDKEQEWGDNCIEIAHTGIPGIWSSQDTNDKTKEFLERVLEILKELK